jgi:putative tricarboxylic transport membrane protein
VVLNLPLIVIWVQILRVPYAYLFPLILLFCLIGSYSLNNLVAEMTIMVIFGGIGYLLKHFEYEAPPLILAFVLGPMIEERLRQALALTQGSISELVTRPITAFFLLATVLILMSSLWTRLVPKKARSNEL